jgi:SOS-response transcriptional repressor LexA
MQQLITLSGIDMRPRFPQVRRMLTHEEILTELIRQVEAKQIRQADIAVKLGIAPSRVAEMRKRERRIQQHEMPVLAELLGLESVNNILHLQNIQKSSSIPVLGKVAQGVWLEQSFSDPDTLEFVEYDRMTGDEDAENLFAVIPEGASMNLIFPPSVTLICRRVPFGFADVNIGDLVIVEREAHDLREMTCKRLKVAANGDYLLCSESDRPEFADPIVVPRSSDDEYVDNGINLVGIVIRGVIDFRKIN